METEQTKETMRESDEETRREFLKNAGKVAIYTPPAIMLLMHPNKNALAISGASAIELRRANRD